MRQPRQTIFAGVLGVFLIAFAWLLLKPHEPSCQGKTLTAWLEEARTKDLINFPEADPAAVSAIRQMGTKAIPTLLEYAATPKDSHPKEILTQLKEKEPRLPIHLQSQYERHILAEYGFYVLGPDAKAAVPKLIALLKADDDSVRESAARCLGRIGPAAQSAVPDLIKEFERDSVDGANGFYSAAFAFAKIGPSARSAIPVLTSGLTNSSRRCRAYAQAALINLQPASITFFLEQVKDTSNSSNWDEVHSITFCSGTNLSPAVPLLISALNCTNNYIQNKALKALGDIHQQPEKCIPAIVPFLGATNGTSRYNSISALRQFGKAAKPAVPDLIRHLDDPNDSIRELATNALREIDPEAAARARIK